MKITHNENNHKVAREQINEIMDHFASLKADFHLVAHALCNEEYIYDISYFVQAIYSLDKMERNILNRLSN